jgi:hypothetical protein
VRSEELTVVIMVDIFCVAPPRKKAKLSRRGPWLVETPRIPHSLDNRFTGGGEVMNLTRRSPFSPK